MSLIEVCLQRVIPLVLQTFSTEIYLLECQAVQIYQKLCPKVSESYVRNVVSESDTINLGLNLN